MKRLLLIAMFIAGIIPGCVRASDDVDRWDLPDKRLHFKYSAIAGAATGIAFESPLVAFGVAMIPGTLRELRQHYQTGHHWSSKDMRVNALGAVAGVALGHGVSVSLGEGWRANWSVRF